MRQGPLTVIWVGDPAHTPPRVGYAISRKVGTAVARNRLRRRLQALVLAIDVPAGAYLISVSPAGAHLSFGELQFHLTQAFSQIRARSPRPG